MTFSIVARSADGAAWGVAVASKFLAAGAVVPGARAGVGAIATQSLANLRYIPQGLERLSAGQSAAEVLAAITAADSERAQRQAGVVDVHGGAATFTGEGCHPWAGGCTGEGYAIQGNILTGPEVVEAMEQAWLASDPAAPLGDRLHAALLAGDRAGGDRRGRQSAALLVVREGAGYGGGSDVALDLRVDDHTDPVPELARLMTLHELVFGTPAESLPLTGATADRARAALGSLGYDTADLERALTDCASIENLEERLVPGAIDPVVLGYLEDLASRRR